MTEVTQKFFQVGTGAGSHRGPGKQTEFKCGDTEERKINSAKKVMRFLPYSRQTHKVVPARSPDCQPASHGQQEVVMIARSRAKTIFACGDVPNSWSGVTGRPHRARREKMISD